jgi:hypothetical protein
MSENFDEEDKVQIVEEKGTRHQARQLTMKEICAFILFPRLPLSPVLLFPGWLEYKDDMQPDLLGDCALAATRFLATKSQ